MESNVYLVILVIFVAICGGILWYLLAHPMLIKYLSRYHKRRRKTVALSLRQVLDLDNEHEVHVESIADNFDRLYNLSDAVKAAGLENSNVIIGIDFSASNEWQGKSTFDHKSLHCLSKKQMNPYQQVISIIPDVLSRFDEDNLIPVFGFGCSETKDHSVFPFKDDGLPCRGFQEVLDRYERVKKSVKLSGPTSLVPIITKAVEITKEKGSYHILLIIMDGQVEEDQDESTQFAIVKASLFPLSIILVGVGDGPWDRMHTYDDRLPARQFDNFHFVDFHRTMSKGRSPEVTFALNALMEIPDQYKKIKSLGMIPDDDETDNFWENDNKGTRRRNVAEKSPENVSSLNEVISPDDNG